MADTYTQLYVHIVFSVKGRHALIPKHHKSELHKYITGIITIKNKIDSNQFNARSYPYFDRDDPRMSRCLVSERHQSKFDALYQPEALDCGAICMARGIRCVQLFTFSDTSGGDLY